MQKSDKNRTGSKKEWFSKKEWISKKELGPPPPHPHGLEIINDIIS